MPDAATVDAFDLVIVGAGPGGYVAAIRAAQLGLRTAVVERDAVGGVCLNWGCIPAKVLLRSAELAELARASATFGVHQDGVRLDLGEAVDHSREIVQRMTSGVEELLARNAVVLVRASARLVDAHTLELAPDGRRLSAGAVILATGAHPRSPWPVDGVRVLTSREALERRETPRSIAILGGGCVGAEFADVFAAAGAAVTVVEHGEHLLPDFDVDTSRVVEQVYGARGIAILAHTRATAVRGGADGVVIDLANGDGPRSIEVECALVALGIEPNTRDLGLAEAGVTLNERGFVVVDALGRSSLDGVWAIGDVTGRMPLAHVASAQGIAAVEALVGRGERPVDLDAVPRVVYCHPEVAAVGLGEQQARDAGHDVQVGRFPLRANGRAMTMEQTEGFVKLIVDRTSRAVLGAQIVGAEASELIAEVALGRALETTPLEIAATVHAHPTFAEAVREAALMVDGGAIHFYAKPASVRVPAATDVPAGSS